MLSLQILTHHPIVKMMVWRFVHSMPDEKTGPPRIIALKSSHLALTERFLCEDGETTAAMQGQDP